MDTGAGEEIHKTGTMKKTNSPKWNEQFQVNVHDAESEILSIRVCNGKKFKPKGKEYLGEINFPLRGAARDFDQPNYQFKWYPLKGNKLVPDNEVGGDILLYIEYIDTRQSQGPTNFQHTSHVGWTSDGGFDVNNIPAEWKKIFQSVGIKKKDLIENPALANDVFKIMNEGGGAPAPPAPPAGGGYNQGGYGNQGGGYGGGGGYDQGGYDNHGGNSGYDQGGYGNQGYDHGGHDQGGYGAGGGYQQPAAAAPAPPPPPMMGGPKPPPPPPAAVTMGGGGFGGGGAAPPPPPPGMGRGGAPPNFGGGGAPPPPPPGGPMMGGGGPPPPPPPMMGDGGGGGGARGGLLGAIQKGTTLRRADTSSPKPPPAPDPQDSGASLADTLKKAMIAHRKDIEGSDNREGADDDEWD